MRTTRYSQAVVISWGHETGGDLNEALRVSHDQDWMEMPNDAEMRLLQAVWPREFARLLAGQDLDGLFFGEE